MHLLLSSLIVSYLNGLRSRELVFGKKRFVKLYCALCLLFGNCEEELPKKPVGRLSADSLPKKKLSADSLPTDGQLSADCLPTDGQLSADCRPTGFLGSSSSQLPTFPAPPKF